MTDTHDRPGGLAADFAALLRNGPALADPTSIESLTLTRQAMDAAAAAYVRVGDVVTTEHVIHAADGFPIGVRVHRPAGQSESLPGVVWMHGGGLIAGSHLLEDGRFDRWCPTLGLVGVAVNYGLAPERPYPGPVNDVHEALVWTYENAEVLGIDATCIGIGGASAGGNLAAAASLMARDRRSAPIAYQVLVYPMLDDRGLTESSHWAVPVWSPAANRFGWDCYLGGRAGSPDVSPYAAPARETNLGGLPPTLICVGSVDGFLDESVDFADRLTRSGVPTDLHVYPGAPHGFDQIAPGATMSRQLRADVLGWLAARNSHH